MEDFSTWIPKQDACEQLGYSYRTLERKLIKLKLRTAQRDVPGRHPITIIHPADFQRLKNQVIPATPAPIAENGTELEPRPSLPPALRNFAAAVLGTLPYPPRKLFLTLREAADYSGLPQTDLERLIASGELKARTVRKGRSQMISRRSLEALT
jgi:excisionase family DNA binding protein